MKAITLTERPSSSASKNRGKEDIRTEKILTIAIRKAHLHPQMAVAVSGEETEAFSTALSRLVRQVTNLGVVAEEWPVAKSLDTLFARLNPSRISNPLVTINSLVSLIKPGGRLVLVIPTGAAVSEGDHTLALLTQAGLVNCLVIPVSLPATQAAAPSEGIVALGASPVLGVETVVREDYAEIAEGQGSCCTPSQGTASCCGGETLISLDSIPVAPSPIDQIERLGYTTTDRQNLPSQATEFSLGCGNPTAFAALQPGEVVLDIGSGGGLDALIAARQVGQLGKVIGVDMTPAMISRARQAAAAAGLENIEFRQGQADALPVESDRVDVIISNCVINLTSDKGRVFQEAWRVLRHDGRLEVSDIVTDIAFLPDMLAAGGAWSSCVTGALPEEEYVDLIRQAGFTQVQVHRSQASLVHGVNVYSAQVSARK